MGRETKTRSKRWEVKGDPNHPQAKWEHEPGEDDWTSKGTGPVNVEKIVPWVNDMEEWSDMMYEAVLELREQLREQVTSIAVLREEFGHLSAQVKGDSELPSKKRPPAAPGHQSEVPK